SVERAPKLSFIIGLREFLVLGSGAAASLEGGAVARAAIIAVRANALRRRLRAPRSPRGRARRSVPPQWWRRRGSGRRRRTRRTGPARRHAAGGRTSPPAGRPAARARGSPGRAGDGGPSPGTRARA